MDPKTGCLSILALKRLHGKSGMPAGFRKEFFVSNKNMIAVQEMALRIHFRVCASICPKNRREAPE